MPGDSRRSTIRLADYTSFGIGGEAAEVIELRCEPEDVALALASVRGRRYFVLGGGTNLLVADDGYSGAILRFEDDVRVEPLPGARYRVSANAVLDDLVDETCQAGLFGLERLAGIPGTVGGALVQNAGAYGQEIAGVVESVTCVNCGTGEVDTLSLDDCRMTYRRSIFKEVPHGWVIVGCTLRLAASLTTKIASDELAVELRRRGVAEAGEAPPQLLSDVVRSVRAPKDHLLLPTLRTAGSFFMNPRAMSATDPMIQAAMREFERRRDSLIASGADWMSPKASVLKTHENGDAELVASLLIATAKDPRDPASAFSPMRAFGPLRLGARGANTIVNVADARATDVAALAREMRQAVSDAYEVRLEPEVVLLGDVTLDQPG